MIAPGWRQRALSSLDGGFDLVVVGGGITGCGVFLDAAQRGLTVLLVERGDLAAGTSSRSSKLVHGGLRYLKQMQLGLTRTASRERDRMLRLSPHLVDALRFVYPVYHAEGMPGWQVELGLALYDRLTTGPAHRQHLAADELARRVPALRTTDLDRAVAYLDARADDARLTLAVAATGAAYGGRLLTRAAVEEGRRGGGGRLSAVVLRDLESGRVHAVTAGVVVNATGVWTDELAQRLGEEGRRLRPSRGSHLVLPASRLRLADAVTVSSPDDGRPVFFIPHPEGVLAGTTDLFHDGSLDDPRPDDDEVDYLLRAAAAAFPAAGLTRADVRGAFAGVRPILDSDATEPSKASREEAIWEEAGLLTVAGGKLTTWRPMAEAVVDRALASLPEERAGRAGRCATAGTPLGALAPPDLAAHLAAARPGLDPAVGTALARRLAGHAWGALDLAARRRDLAPLVAGTDLTAAEVRTHARYGAVLHLDDLLLRRARFGLWQPEAARELAVPAAAVLAGELGWTRRRRHREIDAFAGALEGWTLGGVRPSRGGAGRGP